MDFLPNNCRISDLHAAFKAARKRISKIKGELKCYNQIDNEIEIPSINEIRYVVYHTLKGLDETDPTKQDEEFRRAIRHCQRASYDILEIGITDKIEYFKKYAEKYKSLNISEIIPDWPGFHKKISDINIALAEINRSEYSSGDYHDMVEEKYNEACKIVDVLDASIEEVEKKNASNNNKILRFFISSIFAIISSSLLVKRVWAMHSVDILKFYDLLIIWLKSFFINA